MDSLAASPQTISFEKGPYQVRVEPSHFVEMRDGIRLMTDLYFPEGYEGKLPVILERTPYNKAGHRNSNPELPVSLQSYPYYYASHGYVVAVQDTRGRYESEGDYTLGHGHVSDTEDTLDWFEEQGWFNGKVGMIGCSIPGGNVVRAAMSQHRALRGLVPQSPAFGHGSAGGTLSYGFIRGGAVLMTLPVWAHIQGSKLFYRPSKRLDRDEYLRTIGFFEPAPNAEKLLEVFDQNGALNKETSDNLLHLPVIEVDDVIGGPPSDWDSMASAAPTDTFWTDGDYLNDGDSVSGGALHINSWHDNGSYESFLQFEHFVENATSEWSRNNQYLIMGPLSHCDIESVSSQSIVGEREVGDARMDMWGTYLKWWNYSLKGLDNGFEETPRIQYYLLGANEWRSSNEWPIAGTIPTRLYLTSGGSANTRLGDGSLIWRLPQGKRKDNYVYDPAKPINTSFEKTFYFGSYDSSEQELREDILVYSTESLESPVEITGQMRARIWLSTNVPDTDLSVRLLDVYPDGRAFPIQDGYLRLRYRDGFDEEIMMTPGKTYPIDLNMLIGANLFQKGHKIRIEVSSSNFPQYARNLNTGGDNALDTHYQSANVSIHHGGDTPSYIELPIIPASDALDKPNSAP
ncbi:MAG: CocE/NonD family hydrolase [Pseudomonadota bacterium]